MLLLSIENFIAMSFEPASLTLRRLVLRYRFADYESTRLQDYEWLTPWASLSLRRLRDCKITRLQVAAALLVVSLTRCLVVWRSQAKLNFRDSVVP